MSEPTSIVRIDGVEYPIAPEVAEIFESVSRERDALKLERFDIFLEGIMWERSRNDRELDPPHNYVHPQDETDEQFIMRGYAKYETEKKGESDG